MLLPEWPQVARLGEGGSERWIVYPAVLWLTVPGAVRMPATLDVLERGAALAHVPRRRRRWKCPVTAWKPPRPMNALEQIGEGFVAGRGDMNRATLSTYV